MNQRRWLGSFFLLLFSFSLFPTAGLTFSVTFSSTIIDASPSVKRTLDTVSLLYPGQFHDYDQLQEEIMYFHDFASNLIDLEVIGESYQGRNITCLRITNEESSEQKAKTLVVAHHHGREQITIEMALRFILRLLNNYGVDPILTNYVDTQEIYIIPSLNPDALDYVVNQGNHWLRKNLHPYDDDGDGLYDEDTCEDVNGDGVISSFDVYSKVGGSLIYEYTYYEGLDNDGDGETNEDPVGLVDLNRNYPTGWGNPGSSSDPASEAYHGIAPFSEPETDAFRNFTLNHRFAMAYSLHSGINTTYFPSTQGLSWQEPFLYPIIFDELDDLLPPWFNNDDHYAFTNNRGIRSQLDTGEYGLWQDWMYAERNTLVPICFEVYHNASSDSAESINVIVDNANTRIEEWTGIYGFFNPVANSIENLWIEIQPAFDYLLSLTPTIEVSVYSAQNLGPNIAVGASIHCLSPRLSTVDSIYYLAADDAILAFSPSVEAGTTNSYTVLISPSAIGASNIIRIGNNYTGYVSVLLTVTSTPLLIYLAAGITITVIAIVIVIFLIKWKRTK